MNDHIKNVLVLTVLMECKTDKRKRTANGTNSMLVLHVRFRYCSLSIATPVSLLANGLYVLSVLHREMSLAAVS